MAAARRGAPRLYGLPRALGHVYAHVCSRCLRSFPSRTALHAHIPDCPRHDPQALLSLDTPIVHIQDGYPAARAHPLVSDFHHWQCATVVVNFPGGPGNSTACIDTGCDTTVVSKAYVDEFIPLARRTAVPPINVHGISGTTSASTLASFTALLDADNNG